MKIYVPSRKRTAMNQMFGAYSPMRWLTPKLLPDTYYVVRSDEVDAYEWALSRSVEKHGGPHVLDIGMPENLSKKRQLIAHYADNHRQEKFLMTDDDVMLYIRMSPEEVAANPMRKDGSPHSLTDLRYPVGEEVEQLIQGMDELLNDYPMVGVSMREGNNRAGEGPWPLLQECNRSCRFYAFRTSDYLSIDANRLPAQADHDTVLQFLERGQKNAIICYWANGQPGSQGPGGCSVYRTTKTHEDVCNRLVTLHPGLVTLRQKKNKGEQHGFGTRTEVTVQWKKAYESARNHSA
jgi:hypothetical protein